MALSSDQKSQQKSLEELDELLEGVEKLLERTKVMYEQYFLGIQKLPPSQLHRDIERRIRDLTQEQTRNTRFRFRFNTLCQKFGSYNTYWKRTLRQIEQGTYLRDIARVSRKAARQGEDIADELLVKLPKRMQDRIRRDRAKAAEVAARTAQHAEAREPSDTIPAPIDEGLVQGEASEPARIVSKPLSRVHQLDEDDLDIDGMFAALTGDEAPAAAAKPAAAPAPPAAKPAARVEPPAAAQRALRKSSAPPPVVTTAVPVVPPPGKAVPPATARPAAPSARPGTVRPGAAPIARPPPPPPGGMSEKQTRELYARYVKARELVGESTADLTYEKLVGSLSRQADGIMKQHAAKGVEFSVVIKGDKVVLKAKPQK